MNTVIKVTHKDRKSIAASGIYQLKYRKNSVVKAPAGSFGCMCFETLQAAEEYVAWGFFDNILYLRVKGLGKASAPQTLSFYTYEDALRDFYATFEVYVAGTLLLRQPPPGMICYPAVRVLD